MRRAFIALLVVGVLFALVPAAAAAPPSHAGRPLTASLTGGAEVPGPGDPDGSGTAKLWLNQGQGRICFSLTWKNIAHPFAAHIHKASAGVNGPVVVALFVTTQTTGEASRCVSNLDKALIKDIRQNPQNYYVNVHNADFPLGAIRGQLSK